MKKKQSIGWDIINLTSVKFSTLFLALLNTMLLARFMSLEENGIYSQLLLVINIATTMFMLGLPNSINYFLAGAKKEEDKSYFLSVYLSFGTILSFLTGLILVCLLPFISTFFHNNTLKTYFFFFLIYPWTSIIQVSFDNILVVYQKTRLLGIFKISYYITIIIELFCVQFWDLTLFIYMLCFVAIQVVYALLAYKIIANCALGITFSINWKVIKDLLVYSVPIGISSVIGTINIDIDKLLIGYLMSTEELAIYTNNARELPLTIIATSVSAVVIPKIVVKLRDKDYSGAIVLWKNATKLSFIFISVFVCFGCVCARDLISFLYSDKYLAGIDVFRVYTILLLLRCTYFGTILSATGNTTTILKISFFSLVLNSLLNPISYMLFGVVGPALATVVAVGIVNFLQLIASSKYIGISLSNIFPWKECCIYILQVIPFGILLYLLKNSLNIELWIGEILESILLCSCLITVYFVMIRKSLKGIWKEINMI